ncbi:MAG: hypothetical protein IPP35_03985 [Elusimicrobia bacterium]|nr:hypothetical protein [Elusimicrobiota bacterium]
MRVEVKPRELAKAIRKACSSLGLDERDEIGELLAELDPVNEKEDEEA